MKRYRLTDEAETDLDDIWSFVADDNSLAANRMIDELIAAFASLAEMPGMGRLRDDLGIRPVQLWTVRQYIIVYRSETMPLEIVRVVSGYRDIASLFSE